MPREQADGAEAIAALKAAGLRLTGPRRSILAALSKLGEPASIEQIHGSLGSGRCDLVTVYRCLAALSEARLVRRVFSPRGTGLYELTLGRPPRYRVVCRQTSRIEELDAETSAELKQALEAAEKKLLARGYSDVGHLAEFFGVAPASRPAPDAQAEA